MKGTCVRRFWFHGLCTVGWGFLCLQGFVVYGHLDVAGGRTEVAAPLFEWLGFLAAPVVLLRAALQRQTRVRWWWRAAAAAAGIAVVVAAAWLWMLPGHVRLENTRLLVAPGVFVVSWACVGVVAATTLTMGRAARSTVGLYIVAVAALGGGVFGLMRVVLPGVPADGEEWTFLMAPLIVLAAAACYGVTWIGARRSAQRPVEAL